MSDGTPLVGLAFAVLTVGVGLIGVWTRPEPRPAVPRRPAVGRTAEEVAVGTDPRFRHVEDVRVGPVLDPEVRRALAPLDALEWPGFATLVVVHPLPGDVPRTDLEEGPPWHLVLLLDASLEPTDRLRRGVPGAPPGLPNDVARRALHLAVPHAGELPARRRDVLRALLVRLAGRVREKGGDLVLASDVEGARVPPVPGLDPGAFAPPKEEPR